MNEQIKVLLFSGSHLGLLKLALGCVCQRTLAHVQRCAQQAVLLALLCTFRGSFTNVWKLLLSSCSSSQQRGPRTFKNENRNPQNEALCNKYQLAWLCTSAVVRNWPSPAYSNVMRTGPRSPNSEKFQEEPLPGSLSLDGGECWRLIVSLQ